MDDLLARSREGTLTADECRRLAEAVSRVPGRLRSVGLRLAGQRTPQSVDALLQLPGHTPGALEGVYKAMEGGVTRPHPSSRWSRPLLALDFRNSRARHFPDLLERARAVVGEDIETLRVEGKLHFRITMEANVETRERLRTHASDVEFLHGRLARLAGTRLWLNGWRFERSGPWTAASHEHLVHAWLHHAMRVDK